MKCLKKFYFIFLFFIFSFKFFSEKFQSHPSPDRAVVHDGSSMGAGGLECNKAISQIFIYFYFLLETF
jgi:hypothetical protein